MGGAFFFHVSAVASLLLSTLCGDPCQRLRGVLLHPGRPLDCTGGPTVTPIARAPSRACCLDADTSNVPDLVHATA